MKKVLSLVLACVMLALCVACGPASAPVEKKEIVSPADLEGRSVAVQSGTTADDYITAMVDGGAKITVARYEKITQGFDDLNLKRVDAVIVDSVVASYYMGDASNGKVVWKNDEGEPMGFAMKKGNDKLTAAVEAAIDTLYYNGKMAELATKHFGDNYTAGLRTVTKAPVIDTTGIELVTAGTLAIGMEVGYPPMEYTDDSGLNYLGFDVDIAKELGVILGLKVDLINTTWDGIFEGLNKGSYDVVISAVSITEDRQQNFNMTEAYVSNQLVLVVNK